MIGFLDVSIFLHHNMDILGGALIETGQLVDVCLLVGGKLAELGDEGDIIKSTSLKASTKSFLIILLDC